MKTVFFYFLRTPIYIFRCIHLLLFIIGKSKLPKSATFKINTGPMTFTRIYPLGVGLLAKRNYKKEPSAIAKKAWHYEQAELRKKYPIIVWVV